MCIYLNMHCLQSNLEVLAPIETSVRTKGVDWTDFLVCSNACSLSHGRKSYTLPLVPAGFEKKQTHWCFISHEMSLLH